MTPSIWSLRDALCAAGAVGLAGAAPAFAAAEPAPETKRIKVLRHPADVACLSPMWIDEELLRADGFEDVTYVELSPAQGDPFPDTTTVGAGQADITIADVFSIPLALDVNKPVLA